MKRTFSFIALVAVAACGGVPGSVSPGGSALAPGSALALDGGAPCVVPTVMPLVTAPEGGVATGLVEVDLGEVAAGPDPVVLASVHLHSAPGVASLAFVEGARLSVPAQSGEMLLAAGIDASDDGLVLSIPPAGADLRGLASGGRLPIRLELSGTPPAGALSVTVDVCVTKLIQHAVL